MWKHKTKWLVRGGRKVRCYLCGKKILAKGDLFLFHGDTGYYSHQSCQAESTTISGNERRRAVKKIAVGAAVVGAIAAGAGKLIDISSQSKGSNSPDTQTILTSQGLILPALTSDPANPVAGQMWYRSDKGVTAHFDAIENRVIYSNRIVDGSAVVTSKGIVNGLSVLPNDGQDWGPDTTKGATAPGQYGSPYTETGGFQESLTYLESTGGKIMYVGSGIAIIDVPLTYNSQKALIIEGVRGAGNSNDVIGPGIQPSSSFPSGSFLFNITSTVGNTGSFTLRDFALYGNVGTGSTQVAGGIQGNPNGSTTYAIPQITIDNCKFTYLTDALYFDQEGSGPINIANTVFTYSNHGIHLTGSSGGTNHYVNIETYITNIPIYIDDGSPASVVISDFIFLGTIAFAYVGDGTISMSNGSADMNSSSALYGFGSGSATPYLYLSNCNLTILSGSPAGTPMFAFVDSTPSGSVHWHIYASNTTYTLVGNSGTAYPLLSYNGANSPGFRLYDFGGEVLLQDSASITIGYTGFTTVYAKKINYNYVSPVSTPSVPASGTAQQNTQPYPVYIYIYGGAVTEIQITRNGTAYTVLSVSTAIAMSGQHFPLNNLDSITITYSTAPTWEWLSD